MNRPALPLIAGMFVATLLAVEVAAGGGRYTPLGSANPCAARPAAANSGATALEPLVAQIVLLGLDRAACHLGISRERLVLKIAESRDPLGSRVTEDLKAGLHEVIDRLARGGRLPRTSQLLPQALDQTDIPGIAKTLIEVIPSTVVDRALPLEPLLNQTVDDLDVARLLRQLGDPRKVNAALSSAILHAVLHQVLTRLGP